MGNSDDMQDLAEVLGKIDLTIAEMYATRGNKTEDEFLKAMKAETWMKPDEATDFGLIDKVVENKGKSAPPKAELDGFFFQNIPEEIKTMFNIKGESVETPAGIQKAKARMAHMIRQADTAEAQKQLLEFKQHVQCQQQSARSVNLVQ